MRAAVFLDRDGVINIDRHYVARVEDFTFVDGIFETLRAIRALGYPLVVVTNQSAIGRGYCTPDDYQRLTHWMLAQLAGHGIELAGVYHCPHRPEEGCACRKPAPGMLLQAAREHGVELCRSWMIGDSPRDIEAARRAGVHRTILVSDSSDAAASTDQALFVCPTVSDTVRIILQA